jgi:hypothetical protein
MTLKILNDPISVHEVRLQHRRSTQKHGCTLLLTVSQSEHSGGMCMYVLKAGVMLFDLCCTKRAELWFLRAIHMHAKSSKYESLTM